MVTVPGVMVIQVAKNTLPQSLFTPSSNSINIGVTSLLENSNILATSMLDLITKTINISMQRPKSSNSLKDNTLGSLGLSSFQNHTVSTERSIPTIRCCRSTTPETNIQNVNKEVNEINDLLFTTNLLLTFINTKKRRQFLIDQRLEDSYEVS